MLEIYIDPSYTGTGICSYDTDKNSFRFILLSSPKTKRSVSNYFKSAQEVRNQFQAYLFKLLQSYEPEQITVYMEQPFPGGQSSAGLFGLQFLLLEVLCNLRIKTFGFTPSLVSLNTKKYKGSDSTSLRKKWVAELLAELPVSDYNLDELSGPGCDKHTAFLFWYFIKYLKVNVTLIDYGFRLSSEA